MENYLHILNGSLKTLGLLIYLVKLRISFVISIIPVLYSPRNKPGRADIFRLPQGNRYVGPTTGYLSALKGPVGKEACK
jgi:hypothetical protein